jgi:hypothetical protein
MGERLATAESSNIAGLVTELVSATAAGVAGADTDSTLTSWLKSGMLSQLPAFNRFISLLTKASGFAAKIALTAGHNPTGRS